MRRQCLVVGDKDRSDHLLPRVLLAVECEVERGLGEVEVTQHCNITLLALYSHGKMWASRYSHGGMMLYRF